MKLFFIIFFILFFKIQSKKYWKFLDTTKKGLTKGLNSTGVYSRKFSINNYPGGRIQGRLVNFNNSLYLFGGFGYDENSKEWVRLGDTWQYSLKKKKWRWIDRLEDAKYENFPAWYGTEYTNLNHPGGRSGHGVIAMSNSIFLYGGINVDKYKSDIFEFDPKKKQYRWIDVTGDGKTREENINGNYGTKNYKTNNYYPGARSGFCITKHEDSFYIFGGFGIGAQKVTGWAADLWEYNTIAKKWRFLKTGEQGLLAIASSLDYSHPYPGSRDLFQCWTNNKKLYMYSGRGYSVRENDLWEYDFYTWKWKFIGYEGELQASLQHPVWKLVYSVEAYPGVREAFSFFQNFFNTEEIYIFGGKGKSARGVTGVLGDLWVYNHNKNMWKWIDVLGDKKTQKTEKFESKYGTTFHEHFYPSARENAMGTSVGNEHYLFGGQTDKGLKNDLWVLSFGCFGYHKEHKLVCNGHGKCINENVCECDQFWKSKNDCSKKDEDTNDDL